MMNALKSLLAILLSAAISSAKAQTSPTLADLSFFKSSSRGWYIAGDVKADFNTNNSLIAASGTGILVHAPAKDATGSDLFSNDEYGDIDLEMDFMMAKGSNSGIYLQGRYEIQLGDSWGIINPTAGDNGGVCERWDDARPAGHQGYEGYAPRQNVSKAPGLWQHIKLSFQAPRFVDGRKVANAKLIRVELNNVLIHENVELFGITRGGLEGEVEKGPLRLQGGQGAIAIRNLKLSGYDNQRPELSRLKYFVYKGYFQKAPDYQKLSPVIKGETATLTASINNLPDSFVIRYTGTIKVSAPGEYSFNLVTAAGNGSLSINNQQVATIPGRREPIKFLLPAGELPFELTYSKFTDWADPSLALRIAGPGIREFMISDAPNFSPGQTDPIIVEARTNTTTVLRSFMDIPGQRVVHAVSVGSPEGLHYTYDMDNSALVQVWRGGFLDATPMWHERGDGSSRPTGSRQLLGKPALTLQKLLSPGEEWRTDTVGSGFRPKGYELDELDRPVFHYLIYGFRVTDASQILPGRQGLTREISMHGNASSDLFVRLAVGKKIEDAGGGLYLLDDKSYYVRIDDAAGGKPIIRKSKDLYELLVPISGKLKYSLLF